MCLWWGGGPAGSGVALLLRQLRPDWTVVVVDRAEFPRDKACGDALGPDAVAELAALGAVEVLAGFGPVNRVWLQGVSADAVVAGAAPSAGFVVPRKILDARLLDRARTAGAEFIRRKVKSLEVGSDGVRLDGGLQARYVVGADGATSAVRRYLRVSAFDPSHMAVAVRGYTEGFPDDLDALHIRWLAGSDGRAYVWAFPSEGVANVGGGVFRQAGSQRSRTRLTGMVRGSLPAHWYPASSSVRGHHLPLTTQGVAYGAGPVLLAGDAAGLVDPLSGERIFYALASGAAAAQALVEAPVCPVGVHRGMLRRRFARHFATTRMFARAADRSWAVDRALRAAHRDPRVFDDLVRVALGDGALTFKTTDAFLRAGGRVGSISD